MSAANIKTLRRQHGKDGHHSNDEAMQPPALHALERFRANVYPQQWVSLSEAAGTSWRVPEIIQVHVDLHNLLARVSLDTLRTFPCLQLWPAISHV